jgi:ribonuclease P protein subunit RPR2
MVRKKIAEERIHRLFTLAERRAAEDRLDLADRYVELALKIGMSQQVSIPREFRQRYCHECHSYLVPGRNAKVRINSKRNSIDYHCRACGEVNRYGF